MQGLRINRWAENNWSNCLGSELSSHLIGGPFAPVENEGQEIIEGKISDTTNEVDFEEEENQGKEINEGNDNNDTDEHINCSCADSVIFK